jgi:ABC-2 type transport system ATP-binding protein
MPETPPTRETGENADIVLIDVQNLDAGYGSKVVLHGVNLSFAGGAAGLVGPNGAGKSTLIKTLLGFIPPISGTASVAGLSLPSAARLVRAQVGYMPEQEAFIPGMNAVKFVAYMGELSGLPKSAAMERAHEVLQYVGLEESRYRNVETYSLGMKQRVKLAQAIVHDPKLLLLDEPTNGLDPPGREEMLELVADLTRNKGMSIILCSHLLKDVELVAGEIIVMGSGRVVSREVPKKEDAGTRHAAYGVRIRGNKETFMRRLDEEGMRTGNSEDGYWILVGLTSESSPRDIFRAAEQTGCTIQRLEPRRARLEDVFVKAVGERDNAHL